MRLSSYTTLALLVITCVPGANPTDQDAGQISVVIRKEYMDERADLHLGGASISPVNDHVFQAILVKSDNDKHVFDFYLWELTLEGERVKEWLVVPGIANKIPLPFQVVPCLRVLPNGDTVTVVVDDSGIPSLVKIDVRGRIVFTTPLAGHREEFPRFTSIVPISGGQLLVLGQLQGKPAMVKVDELGSAVFKKRIGLEGDGICADGVQLSDNRFRICGASGNGNVVRSWVVDVDGQGEVQGEIVFANAAWPPLSHDRRIAQLESNRTAFVHPVTVEGKTYCHVAVLNDALEQIAEVRLCEVPGYVGAFQVQRRNTGLVIAAVSGPRAISLYVMNEDLTVRAVGEAQDLFQGNPFAFNLAVDRNRALILAQRGSPMVKKSHAIGCAVFDLKDH